MDNQPGPSSGSNSAGATEHGAGVGSAVGCLCVFGSPGSEAKAMKIADGESARVRKVEGYMERADIVARATKTMPVPKLPPPKFGNGQIALQWWASWFTPCALDAAPRQYSKKQRPSWYVGEVETYGGIMDVTYAGVEEKATHAYYVH